MRRVLIPVLVVFLLTGILPGTCRADTIATTATLSVEQAIDMALDNREDVKVALLELEAAGISSDLASDNGSPTIVEVNGDYQFLDTGDVSDQAIYTAEYNEKAKRKSYNTKLESVKFSVYNRYYDVVDALDKVDAQNLANQQAAENLRITQLRSKLGMETKLSLYQAQTQASSAESSLTNAQLELDQKYITLMEYIGMSSTSRPTLVRELTYAPVNIANPESKFEDIVNASPSVWLAKESLKLTQDTAGYSDSGDLDYIDEEMADINIITTKESMLQTTRNIYYSLKNIEDSYATAKDSVAAAEEAVRVAQLMLELGMTTKTDVLAAEITANTAQQNLDSISYQHAILAMALEKPWAYGAAN